MIRQYHRKSACTGKLRYRTMEEAEMEMERAQKFRGETLRAYACSLCGAIHLTSQPKRKHVGAR